MDSIQEAIMMNAGRIMIRERIIAGPKLLNIGTVLFDLHQDRAATVTCRKENQVVDNHRHGCCDRTSDWRLKTAPKRDFSASRLKCHQFASRQDQCQPTVSQSSSDRRRIARLVV